MPVRERKFSTLNAAQVGVGKVHDDLLSLILCEVATTQERHNCLDVRSYSCSLRRSRRRIYWGPRRVLPHVCREYLNDRAVILGRIADKLPKRVNASETDVQTIRVAELIYGARKPLGDLAPSIERERSSGVDGPDACGNSGHQRD